MIEPIPFGGLIEIEEDKNMGEMSNFQKKFLVGTQGGSLFTQKEFDEAVEVAKLEIMAVAMDTAKMAVKMERDACAKLVDQYEHWVGTDPFDIKNDLVTQIQNRIPSQNQ
jgi:hypothetical protein